MALAANFRGKAAGTRLPEDQSQGFRHDRPRRHGSKAGYTSGWLGSTPEGRRPQIRGFRAGGSLAVASSTPATQLLSPAKMLKLNQATENTGNCIQLPVTPCFASKRRWRSARSLESPLSIQEAKQDFGVGGFHEVRVEATGQRTHAILVLTVAGDGDEPGFGGSRVHPDRARDRIAVHAGKSHVADDHVGSGAAGGLNAFHAGVGQRHLIALGG